MFDVQLSRKRIVIPAIVLARSRSLCSKRQILHWISTDGCSYNLGFAVFFRFLPVALLLLFEGLGFAGLATWLLLWFWTISATCEAVQKENNNRYYFFCCCCFFLFFLYIFDDGSRRERGVLDHFRVRFFVSVVYKLIVPNSITQRPRPRNRGTHVSKSSVSVTTRCVSGHG